MTEFEFEFDRVCNHESYDALEAIENERGSKIYHKARLDAIQKIRQQQKLTTQEEKDRLRGWVGLLLERAEFHLSQLRLAKGDSPILGKGRRYLMGFENAAEKIQSVIGLPEKNIRPERTIGLDLTFS